MKKKKFTKDQIASLRKHKWKSFSNESIWEHSTNLVWPITNKKLFWHFEDGELMLVTHDYQHPEDGIIGRINIKLMKDITPDYIIEHPDRELPRTEINTIKRCLNDIRKLNWIF